MESHRKALAIAEELTSRGYDPKVQRLLAVAHHRVGYLIESAHRGSVEGIDHYRQSLELLEHLNRDAPSSYDVPALLLSVYGHHGDAELVRGRIKEAAASYQRTLEVAEQWSRRSPGDRSNNALGSAHRRVSRSAQLTGDLQKALFHAKAAIPIHEQLVADQPSSVPRRRELLNSYEQLAFVNGNPEYLNLGDRQAALAANRKVVEIAQSLLDADPKNRMAGSDLAIAKRSACLFLPEDDTRRIVTECQEAVEVSTRHGRNFYEDQPSAASRLGPAYWKLRRPAEARETMERAVQLLNAATTNTPWRTDLQLQLVRIHNKYGALLVDMGGAVEARDHFQSALVITQILLPSNPQNLVLRREIADCYANLGRLYAKSDQRQAADWYRKELLTWSEWPRTASSNLDRNRRAEASRNVARLTGAP
jgi:tetratricopeptide (TPR) repeat protein